MKKRIYGKEQFNIGKWSGGETSEYAIYPESAKYIDRDFIWRLSSASVDVEESVFTKLPDYDRILMVLEGDAILVHGDERTVKLAKGQQDSFGGDVKTKCFGKIRDYNLMFKKGCYGSLAVIEPQSEAKAVERADQGEYTHCSYGFYCESGYAVIQVCGESHMVGEGKQLVLDFEPDDSCEMLIMGEGKVIMSEVFYSRVAHAAVEIPEEKATFEDFKTAFKLAKGRNKWKQMTGRNNNVWYDEALKDKLALLDKTYIGIILWVLVTLLFVLLAVKGMPHTTAIVCIVLWTLLYAFVISPLIYMIVLPKPIKAHIKDVENLTEYELKLYEKELAENGMSDKILRKYKHSGRDTWDEDYESVFSRLRK